MMIDELRKAAERVRRVLKGEPLGIVYSGFAFPAEAFIEETQAIAAAYLAENDPTELTEEWLRSVGALATDHPQKFRFHREERLPIGLWIVDDGWKAMVEHSARTFTCIVRGLKTRGEFRTLARALGIALNSP